MRLRTGVRLRIGLTGPMRRGEIWFAASPGGDRPVLVLTRDPVADRIGSAVVAALTRTVRGLVSELELTPSQDGVPTACVANFDNLHTLPRDAFRRPVTTLSAARMHQACQVLLAATGC
jgi:mRNA interferase MazF